jgi:hypothetical protein
LRANGAIEGGAAAFSIGDEVCVLKKIKESPAIDEVKVIGHTDGVRHCGEYAVCYIVLRNYDVADSYMSKRAVVMWNIAKNEAVTWHKGESGECTVIDYDDAEYQAWRDGGQPDLSTTALGSTWPYDSEPHKLAPELTDDPVNTSAVVDYHAYRRALRGYNMGRSQYTVCSLPRTDSAPAYVGLRTSKDITKYPNPWGVYDYIAYDAEYGFYGFFGLMRKEDILWDTNQIPEWMGFYIERSSSWNDHEWYMRSKYWYHQTMNLRYSGKSILAFCNVQYCTFAWTTVDGHEKWTFVKRVNEVQAAAINCVGGSTDYNWLAAGNNTALAAKLKEAIEYAYTLNSVPSTEIRNTECWMYAVTKSH